jgi:hypothetical protein
MAVEKAALISPIGVVSAACRVALDAAVDKFSEAVEATSPAALRRRLKQAHPNLDIAIAPLAACLPTLSAASDGPARAEELPEPDRDPAKFKALLKAKTRK